VKIGERGRGLLAACLLAGLPSFAQDDAQGLMHGVPVETKLSGPLTWGEVSLRVTLSGARALPAFLSRRGAAAADGGVWTVDVLDAAVADEPAQPRHTKATWVVDFDQPAFGKVWGEAVEALGPRPAAEAVTAFVRRVLVKKDYSRGFDLASKVAARREGDCTEHSVFLAALLRRFGIPARAMVGLVLLPTRGAPVAFGHMWVEARVEGRWRTFDAAVPREANPAYLPSGELSDEGPGFGLTLMQRMAELDFRSIGLGARASATGTK